MLLCCRRRAVPAFVEINFVFSLQLAVVDTIFIFICTATAIVVDIIVALADCNRFTGRVASILFMKIANRLLPLEPG